MMRMTGDAQRALTADLAAGSPRPDWSALMYSRMFSATMCEFFLLRMWFCVTSAPGNHQQIVEALGAPRLAIDVLQSTVRSVLR